MGLSGDISSYTVYLNVNSIYHRYHGNGKLTYGLNLSLKDRELQNEERDQAT